MTKSIQIVGPYFTNYSLAKVNRNLAEAINNLNSDYKAFLYCDKNEIDYLPTNEELNKLPQIKDIVKFEPFKSDISIYNNFPKSTSNLHGLKNLNSGVKLMYTAWEDDLYPQNWVHEINDNLHGVMVSSKFVKETLMNSGVKVPIEVVNNALENSIKGPNIQKYPINTKKSFKFLHISTAKYRKGIDVLLRAYFKTFTSSDDCTLIIKSFPGPDNMVEDLLKELRTENSPEVIHLTSPDFTDEELAGLNIACDCAVYPTRGEGFGLPILEAMQLGIPLITTGYSGQMDFCNFENSYLLDYNLVVSTKNELVNLNSHFAEPDENQLRKFMKEIFELKMNKDPDGLKLLDRKIRNAKKTADSITLENSAKKAIEFIKKVENASVFKTQNAAVLTFLNDQTGINIYSRDLYKNIEKEFKNFYYLANADIADRTEMDADNVIRNWSTGETSFEEIIKFLKEKEINILHIQYHTGEFPPESLNLLLEKLKPLNIKVCATLHSVKSTSFDLIKSCAELGSIYKVIFHNKEDFDYASNSFKNCVLMRIPRTEFKTRDINKIRKELNLEGYSPIIATHGLLNTNKGVDQIIEATKLLKAEYPNILCLCLSAVSSNNIFANNLLEELQNKIKQDNLESNVVIISDFLDKKVIEILLQSVDINILAYVDIAGESASAAVEKTLASLRPTIVTDIKAFEELNSEVLKIKNNNAETIQNAVESLLKNPEKQRQIIAAAKKNIEESSYLNKSLETLSFYI